MTHFAPLSLRRTLSARGLVLIALLMLIPAVFAQGGPPLVTDDPGTPGNKHWEVNIAYTQTRYSSSVVYEVPHIDLNYGYGDNVQLKLEGPLTVFNGDGGNSFTALGYTNWGVKWRFQEETKSRPAISTYPQVLFVGNERLSQYGAVDPGTDVFLPMEIMKTFGLLQLDAEAGVMFRQFTDTEYWTGICGGYQLTKTLGLLGEVHLITLSTGDQDQLIWNLGFKQDLSENQSIIFSAGRSFASPGGDNPAFLMYAGIQVRT